MAHIDGTSRSRAPNGRATLLIPVYNQLGYTEACLASLREMTRYPYGLVIIDNGSSDGTGDYLAELEACDWPLHVIRNTENLGFTLAVNQGMRAADGDYVVLLNNDTTMKANWLWGLIRVAGSADDIGIVGPKVLHPDSDTIRTIGGLVFYKGHTQGPPGENCPRDDPRVVDTTTILDDGSTERPA